jgi:beta-lactamase regulating signal transducer with metallopeptidase domain
VLVLQFVLGTKMPPCWRYALWLLVVARLLMPVTPASTVSLFNWIGWRSTVAGAPTSVVPPGTQGAGETPALRSQDPIATTARDVGLRAETLLSSSLVQLEPASPTWREVVAWVWLLGATGYGLFVLVQHGRLAGALRHAKPVADPRFLSLLEEGRSMLGVRKHVTTVETSLISTPAIFGFLQPRLLIPASLMSSWDERELRHVILHELVHVRRRDVLLNWVLVFVQALHWFNPAVWFALRRLRAEREVLCDAVVLSHLHPTEHRGYGATLIKLVHAISQPVRLPSLAPILNTPNEIERRMTMITQFKPSTRRAAFASAVLLLALAGLTFTRAADKEMTKPAAPVAAEASADVAKKVEAERRERGILTLENERAVHLAEINKIQREMDQLKEKLQISELDAATSAALMADSLREFEKQRISTTSEYQRLHSLYQQLTNFTRAELRRSIPTASPDPLLHRLLEEEAIADQKIAEGGNIKSLSHPEVAGLLRRRETIEKQIDERVDGIMAGLRIRLEGLRVQLNGSQAEFDKLKQKNIEESIQRRPYYDLKRLLENLQFIVERLNVRIWQEKVDAALPPGNRQ